jgi:arsenate reductase
MTGSETEAPPGTQAENPAVGLTSDWKLYGIPNCDTVKKARKFLEANGIPYGFQDWKKGVDAALLQAWVTEKGWEILVNRSGTTWRSLSDDQKAVTDAMGAIALMQEKPSLIRRPILTDGRRLLVGFDEATWRAL